MLAADGGALARGVTVVATGVTTVVDEADAAAGISFTAVDEADAAAGISFTPVDEADATAGTSIVSFFCALGFSSAGRRSYCAGACNGSGRLLSAWGKNGRAGAALLSSELGT